MLAQARPLNTAIDESLHALLWRTGGVSYDGGAIVDTLGLERAALTRS
jgi:hypothetical protein